MANCVTRKLSREWENTNKMYRTLTLSLAAGIAGITLSRLRKRLH